MNRSLPLVLAGAAAAALLFFTGCSSCPKGQTSCGSTCADLQTDNANCGACGKACSPGTACAAGACSATCATGFSVCASDGGPSFCANLKEDPENCGACGTACPAGEVCSAGACAESCAAGTTACADKNGGHFCADLQKDVNDCGTCGKTCSAGQLCDAGKCVLSCAAGTTECQRETGAPFCANLSTDTENCGVCGHPCPTGQVCASGVCAESCATGLTICGGTLDGGVDGGAPYCANLMDDLNNCGACGSPCPTGQFCISGACAESCATGFTPCGGMLDGGSDGGIDAGAPYCANLMDDVNNCGACGSPCPTGQFCISGACTESCATGFTPCGGMLDGGSDGGIDAGAPYCANLMDDVNNCGACGSPCPTGQFCISGACAESCATGFTPCGGILDGGSDGGIDAGAPYCANLMDDVNNCGACGSPCPTGQFCISGACAESCATGFTPCGGMLDGGSDGGIDGGAPYCANLMDDVNNCGACGSPCPTGQFCISGACAESCATGFTPCGGMLDGGSDGGIDAGAPYCANLLADMNNCGSCGVPCPPGQLCNGAGKCATSCLASEFLCGGLCTDTLTDPGNCGGCAGDGGMRCPIGQVCDGTGKCTETCASGYAVCGADAGSPYCADLAADSRNCGACGTSCDPGATCDATGHCVCATSGNADCTAAGAVCEGGHCGGGSACTDTSADPANCGACGSVCAGGACYNGTACLCPSGKTFCGTGGSATAGACRDFQTDDSNCGACGRTCVANNGATASCTKGSCACADGVTEGSVAGGQPCSSTCDCVSGLHCTGSVCGGKPTALIFGPSVTNGSSSMEATNLVADGFTVTVVDAAEWESLTKAQFGSYQVLVFGDPTCGGSASTLSPAVSNETTWVPVVNGNVIVIGTDPAYHNTYGHPSAGTFAGHALAYAGAQTGKTGLYVDLSCYYASTGSGSDAPILDGLETGFVIQNGGGNASHVVASVPQLLGVTDADLSNWEESIHETFSKWPSDFVVYAIDTGRTGYTAPDGTKGAPYILGRGGGLSAGATGLEGPSGSGFVGTQQTLTASVQSSGAGVSGASVAFTCVSGPNAGATATVTSNGSGLATYSYTSSTTGTDEWTATSTTASVDAAVSWF